MDHGSQFKSDGFLHQLRYWGFSPSFGFVKEPETNGVIERFHRTLKEQVIHGRVYRDIEELRRSVAGFISTYNDEWLLEKLGYLSPHQARAKWEKRHAA
jgi:putative transposase